MSRFHARVGDQGTRDAVISVQQMLTIQDLLEAEWEEVVEQDDNETQWHVVKMATLFLIGYCCTLCGFELPKIVLSELRNNMIAFRPIHGYQPHVGILLQGWFKARSNATIKLLAFTAVIKASGLMPGL